MRYLNYNEIDLREQLERLTKKQEEAEKIYKLRVQMGDLSHNQENIKELAQTILDRKIQIDDLKVKIEEKENIEDKNKNYETSNKDKKEMIVYKKENIILRWLQGIIDKVEQKIQQLDTRSKQDPMEWYKEKAEQGLADFKKSEYEFASNMGNKKEIKTQEKKSWELDPEQKQEIQKGQVEIGKRYREREKSTKSFTQELSKSQMTH